MRNVPNDIVSTLLRCLPIILDNVDVRHGKTRLVNAVRLVRKVIVKLEKIEQNGKDKRTENQC